MAFHRCIENKYPDYDEDEKQNYEQDYELLGEQVAVLMKEIKKNYPANRSTKMYSNGKKKLDPSLYTGTGGNVYLYYKLLEFGQYSNKEKLIEDFLSALEVNEKIVKESKLKGNKSTTPSFFMSSNGLYTMACLFYHYYCEDKDAEEKFEEYLEKILDSSSLYFHEDAEDELLYGNAGYLYCLLTLYELQIDETTKSKLLKVIEDVAYDLFKIGAENGETKQVLLYYFPRDGGRPYLGGAHGLIGVIYMLLKASKISENLWSIKDFSKRLKNSVKVLTHVQTKSGNFPSCFGKDKDKLLHFCHGAPGAIPLLTLASEIWKKDGFLGVAEKAGELIWERGLLRKGFGICHGISGNTYALHNLYRATGDEKWKYRAMIFAKATADKEIQQEVEEYEDSSRFEVGVPDTPYSLMEGMAGNVVMLVDMIQQDEREPKFPGYEI